MPDGIDADLEAMKLAEKLSDEQLRVGWRRKRAATRKADEK